MQLHFIDLQRIETDFGIDVNTSATILISLFVFVSGFLFRGAALSITRHIESKRLRSYFRVLIEEASKQFTKKAEEFENNAKALSLYEDGSFKFSLGTAIAVKAVEELGYRNVYQVFFNAFRIKVWYLNLKSKGHLTERMKAFHKIWNILLTNDCHINRSIQGIDDFFKHYNQFNDKRNIANENNRLFYEPYIVALLEGELQKYDADYVIKVYKIYKDWFKLSNRNVPTVFHRNLIVKLRILNIAYQKHIIALKMNHFLLESSKEYGNMSALVSSYKEQYRVYSESFKETSSDLVKLCNSL